MISNPSWDVIVLGFFVAAGFFYGLLAGKSRLISVLLSTYLAAFIYENFRFLDFLVKGRSPLEVLFLRGASFFAILVIVSLIISRFFRRDWEGESWFLSFLLSFLEVGLLLALVFQFLPARELITFSPVVENVFAGEAAFFWWLVGPLVALWLISR